MSATVVVSGRLGGDPEVKDVRGNSVLEFNLAESAGRDETRWWRVSVWGKRGESLHEHGLLFKGRHVTVVGELRRAEAYSGKNGLGVQLDISAHSVDIGPRQERGGGNSQGGSQGGWGGSSQQAGSNSGGSNGGWGGGRPQGQQGGGWGGSQGAPNDSTSF